MSTFLSLNHHMELPDDVFRLLRDAIYKRTGMWFADSAKYLLQKRLSPRAHFAKASSTNRRFSAALMDFLPCGSCFCVA